MVWLIIAFTIVLLGLMASVFLLGFRLGGDHWQSELLKVRLQAAQAERQLHDLTREAFVSMAEHAEGRRQQR
jgi:uncharacterized membrane protein YciS (DUF1049 family)